MSAFRRPRLPAALRAGEPRRLTAAEARALRARPWPRLPWWLWLALALAVALAVTTTVVLLGRAGSDPPPPRPGARRSPPAAGSTHGVGAWTAPALDPTDRRVARGTVTCPRLAGLRLAGTPAQVALLQDAAGKVCALRSDPGVDTARTGLREAGAVVAFAGFELSGNESTTVLRPPAARAGGRRLDLGGARVAVLLNGRFGVRFPERAAVLLIHEGAHLAAGGQATAEGELVARRAELAACGRLFPGGTIGGGASAAGTPVEPNRGCGDARELLALGDAGALAELRAAGYR